VRSQLQKKGPETSPGRVVFKQPLKDQCDGRCCHRLCPARPGRLARY
jgi:hypothetical protein